MPCWLVPDWVDEPLGCVPPDPDCPVRGTVVEEPDCPVCPEPGDPEGAAAPPLVEDEPALVPALEPDDDVAPDEPPVLGDPDEPPGDPPDEAPDAPPAELAPPDAPAAPELCAKPTATLSAKAAVLNNAYRIRTSL